MGWLPITIRGCAVTDYAGGAWNRFSCKEQAWSINYTFPHKFFFWHLNFKACSAMVGWCVNGRNSWVWSNHLRDIIIIIVISSSSSLASLILAEKLTYIVFIRKEARYGELKQLRWWQKWEYVQAREVISFPNTWCMCRCVENSKDGRLSWFIWDSIIITLSIKASCT